MWDLFLVVDGCVFSPAVSDSSAVYIIVVCSSSHEFPHWKYPKIIRDLAVFFIGRN
jgi:hypothetical protein